MLFRSLFVGLLAATLLPAVAVAQEKVENPSYKSWAKFKKGTTVIMKSINEYASGKAESTVTMTLVEITPDKVIIEVKSITKVNGLDVTSPDTKIEQPKLIPLPEGVKKEEFGKPKGLVAEGEETVKVGSVDFKAKWTKSKTKQGDLDIESQVWTHDEIPGSMVKYESRTTGKMPTVSKMDVTGVKYP
jgi:hypothetical protein